jgi:N,N'-diacetyllegionaminate synthase
MNRRNASNTVNIAGTWIGDTSPCFIIAEAGSNHNGSLQHAKNLIDVALEANANAVKFQLFRANKLYPTNAGQSDYLKSDRSIYDIVADMEIPYEWLPELAAYCQQKGIIFLSSVFDEESVDRLDPYVPAYKIASYEMTHLPLVRYIAGKGKPVIISTGTANLEEVDETVEAFFETGNRDLLLMQCTASYPAPLEYLNLRAITTMKSAFGVPVGFSDHSRDPLVGPMAAVAVGADLVEKHFTLGNRLPGPDHSYAVEPEELSAMVRRIREAELTLGNGEKSVQSVEAELRHFARRSIFATQDIASGEVLTLSNVAVLRCGKLAPGLEPKYYDTVLGKFTRRPIQVGSAIQRDDYA